MKLSCSRACLCQSQAVRWAVFHRTDSASIRVLRERPSAAGWALQAEEGGASYWWICAPGPACTSRPILLLSHPKYLQKFGNASLKFKSTSCSDLLTFLFGPQNLISSRLSLAAFLISTIKMHSSSSLRSRQRTLTSCTECRRRKQKVRSWRRGRRRLT
jgi:hypothetical protein